MKGPSRDVRLYGTEEAVSEPRILRAGPLSAEFEAGNLRHIRFGGLEIMRAISFIVRDRNWGTYNPLIEDLSVEEREDGFDVSYRATVADESQRLTYRARIVGTPTSIAFSGEGEALTDFLTNRTGFVVLHPLEGVAGQPVAIEHVDGSREAGRFPDLISPLQPMLNLRALTHVPVPGVTVTCRMEGDAYEMEDQRNWTDASYKTYVRPLAAPWPYTIGRGETTMQSVTLGVAGAAPPETAADRGATVSIGAPGGPFPRIGIGMMRSELAATRDRIDRLADLAPRHLVYHHDPRVGSAADLGAVAEIAARIGAEAWLEAVVCEVEDFESEVEALGRTLRRLGSPFKVVFVSPAADLKATLPGSPWPPAPPLDALYRVARRVFPDVRLGGGMYSFFTELNRKRPPVEDLDLVGFTTVAVFHAGDDRTVIENLESLPFIAATAQEIADGCALAVGPSAIGLRMNPYGVEPMKNPDNIRQAMHDNDPRQRGLLGAAWAVGHVGRFVAGKADFVTLGGTTGGQGVLSVPQPWPQPFYDGKGGLYPIYHVERAMTRFSDHPACRLDISDPTTVQGVAVEIGGQVHALIANLTPDPRTIELSREIRAARVLDEHGFVEAAADPRFLDHLRPAEGRAITLGGFAVASLRL